LLLTAIIDISSPVTLLINGVHRLFPLFVGYVIGCPKYMTVKAGTPI